jgi:ABC-2 type transport system ATP-binding protein
MDEAQHLADRVAVIAKGRIVAAGPPATLGGRHLAKSVIRFRPPPAGDLPPEIASLATRANDELQLVVTDPTRILHELTSWAVGRGVELEGLEVSRPTLEDVYLELTGGEAGAE